MYLTKKNDSSLIENGQWHSCAETQGCLLQQVKWEAYQTAFNFNKIKLPIQAVICNMNC